MRALITALVAALVTALVTPLVTALVTALGREDPPRCHIGGERHLPARAQKRAFVAARHKSARGK